MQRPFPASPAFTGHNAPVRIEADLIDCEIEGHLPEDLQGQWFRLTPDPQFAPRHADDHFLNGDGMISALHFHAGRVDYKSRWVQTEKYRLERAAQRALFGAYRNPFTDDPSVEGRDRTTANTTPVWHAGRLLALKEDGRPYRIDPDTLETLGVHDFGGRLRSRTLSAHPKIDPDSGEMFMMGYEADTEASPTVALVVVGADGELRREEWFDAPYASFMHDFAVTRDHIVFTVFPTTVDLDRMKAGGPRWMWDGSREVHVGVMPRAGSVKDLRWFQCGSCFAYHVMNAFSQGQRVHVDLMLSQRNPFPFIADLSGVPFEGGPEGAPLPTRWTFDLGQGGESFEQRVLAPAAGDMPSVPRRYAMRDSPVGYYASFDPSRAPLMSGPVGPGFNTLCRLDLRSGALKTWFAGDDGTLHEPIHIAAKDPGHEGYMLVMSDQHRANTAAALVFEAEHIERGPVARVKLPLRQRQAFHATWVDADARRTGATSSERP